MKNFSLTLIKAIFAGVLVGLMGYTYLTILTKDSSLLGIIIGAFVFSLGLLSIVGFKLNLFTGKVGNLVTEHKLYFIDILVIILGNLLGTAIIAILARLHGDPAVVDFTTNYVNSKLGLYLGQSFILAIFCGILMHLGVSAFNELKVDGLRVISIILAVMAFILGGYEHSIANLFYFIYVGLPGKSLIYLLIMLLGNGIGGCFIALLIKFIKKSTPPEEIKN